MKKIKKIIGCLLLTGMFFLCSCRQDDTFYISGCPIEEIKKMDAVKLIIEQCVFRNIDVNDFLSPNVRWIQTKYQAIQIIENPKSWQPDMEFSGINVSKWQENIGESYKPLENFDCIFAVHKKFTFIDKNGNRKWICFVNVRSLKK
jgi:hypothetical protein